MLRSRRGDAIFFVLFQAVKPSVVEHSLRATSSVQCEGDNAVSCGRFVGNNLFVSAYHGFAQLGDEHVPEPAPWEEFPTVWAGFSSAAELEDGSLRIDLRTKLDGNADPTRYRVVAKLLMTEPGHTRTGGFYRTFLALSNFPSADAEVRFVIPDFRILWPVVGPSYQVHCRYLLVDTQTGYRNIFRKTSFLMEME